MIILENIDNMLFERSLQNVDFKDVVDVPRILRGDKDYMFTLMHRRDFELKISNTTRWSDLSQNEIVQTDTYSHWVEQIKRKYELYEFDEDSWEEWRVSSGIDMFLSEYKLNNLDKYDMESIKNTETYKKLAISYLEDKFADTVGQINMSISRKNGRIKIWRMIGVDDDWLEHLESDGKRLGIYWSRKKEKASIYSKRDGKNNALIESSIKEKYVNWNETIRNNMMPSFEREKEIRLFKNTPISIDKIWINREMIELSETIKNKKFKA